MSTRSQWSFREKGKQIALIYKHSDGYPDGESGGFAVWNRFIDKIVKDAATSNYGYRFDDAEYLAARFVVFLAVYENKENNLAFGGIGVSKELDGDIEYLYEIDCDNSNVPAFRCKSDYSGNYSGKYVNEHNLEMSKHGNKPKGSIKVKGQHFNSIQDAVKFKPNSANDSHLKLKRNSLGHFIRMDDIAEFKYPHNDRGGYCQLDWRQVKVIKEVNNTIEGIQCNGDNTGYKRFDKSKMVDIIRYRGYIKAGDWS
jgi:hypothetical protein